MVNYIFLHVDWWVGGKISIPWQRAHKRQIDSIRNITVLSSNSVKCNLPENTLSITEQFK